MARRDVTFDKVNYGSLGAGAAGFLTVLVVEALDNAGAVNLPVEIHSALTLLISAIIVALVGAAGSYVAGYAKVETKGYRRSQP
jgi:uncharacterized membrane protein YjjP (DUF1212 family)